MSYVDIISTNLSSSQQWKKHRLEDLYDSGRRSTGSWNLVVLCKHSVLTLYSAEEGGRGLC